MKAPEIRPGYGVVLQPPALTGVRPGLYLVLAVGPGGLEVTPVFDAGAPALHDQIVVQPSWAKAVWVGEPTEDLPKSIRDVLTPAAPAEAPAAAAPRRDVQLVPVSIYDPRRLAYSMRRGIGKDAEDVMIEVVDGDHVNRRSGSRRVALFPEDLVERFLGTPDGDGCYRIDDVGADDPEEFAATLQRAAEVVAQPRVRVGRRG